MNGVKKIYNWFSSKSTIAALLLLLIFSGAAFASKNFLSFDSLMNVARKAASDGGFLALGMTFVILIGQIDLSVGSVMAMAGVIAGLLQNVNPIVALLGGLCVGVVCGFVNGLMVAKMRVASWIATLAMMLAMRGAVLLVTNQKPVSISRKFFQQIGNLQLAGIPLLVVLLVALTLLGMHISRNTRYGMALYAVGGNEEAARMMGLKVDRVKIMAYICCGLFAALAGILLAGRMYTAQPNAGKGWETTAIAMCALGGVKLSGGEGKFSGAFFGALVISVITTIFNYAPNVNTWWQNVVMGLLVLLSVGLQSEVFKSRRGARKAEK
ncbi:MAG: ABC transporter permease [Clostridia bacterium]|nr:ABC transporter permease [Clostridia bacterium]